MAIAYGGKNAATSIDGASGTVTLNSITVSAGDLIVVTASIFNGNTIWTLTSITDGTNTYTVRAGFSDQATSSQREIVAWAIASAGGTYTPQINLNGAAAGQTYAYGGVSYFTGVHQTTPEVTWDGADDLSLESTDVSAGPITTTSAGDLIVGTAGIVVPENTAQAWGSPTNWTNLYRNSDGYNTATAHDSGYWLPGSVQTTYSPQWSHTNFSVSSGAAVVVAFAPAEGGPAQLLRSMTTGGQQFLFTPGFGR